MHPYTPSELTFAYSYQVFLRWQTHRSQTVAPLAALSQGDISPIAEKYGIKLLDHAASPTDIALVVGLKPEETVSACTGKLKGQLSKLLRGMCGASAPATILAKGYYACTVGKSISEAVQAYLDKQGDHHGYGKRVIPPIHVEKCVASAEDDEAMSPVHAHTDLRFHVVLASSGRNGIFGSESGPAVCSQWKRLEKEQPVRFLKMSFVPDHVHLAVRAHPSVSLPELVCGLMNTAQELMWSEFRDHMLQAGQNRLWMPSAYLGSFGELSAAETRGYVKKMGRLGL